MPYAAERPVPACPAANWSCGLSLRRRNPDGPPAWRSVGKRSFRPVRIFQGVALMAHVPHDLVAGRVEAVPQRHGQLDYAQAGADVTAGLRDDVDQPAAHLVREGLELVARQAPDVFGSTDELKQRHRASSMRNAECGMRN